MAKMGRPFIDNPKASKISIRFTDEELRLLRQRAEETNQTMAEVIREGIKTIIQPKRR